MNEETLLACACLALAVACDDKPEGKLAATSASVSATPAPSAPPSAAAVKHELLPIPSGPVLAILRGQGLGPIRFGATQKTVERLMQKPCEQTADRVCRYPTRALEFVFGDDGGAVEMTVFAIGEPVGGTTSGVFNGRAPSGLIVGMLEGALIELEGKPTRSEKLDGKDGYVERLHYADMRADIRKKPNGERMLARLTLIRPGSGGEAAPSAGTATPAPAGSH